MRASVTAQLFRKKRLPRVLCVAKCRLAMLCVMNTEAIFVQGLPTKTLLVLVLAPAPAPLHSPCTLLLPCYRHLEPCWERGGCERRHANVAIHIVLPLKIKAHICVRLSQALLLLRKSTHSFHLNPLPFCSSRACLGKFLLFHT